MSRSTLKTILAILITILAAGSAGASECRGTDISLKRGERVLRVNEAAYYKGKADETNVERTVFRGSIAGKPYVVDVVVVQGALLGGGFSSAGTQVAGGEIPVRWGALTPAYRSGETLSVLAGPIEGDWKVVCRR